MNQIESYAMMPVGVFPLWVWVAIAIVALLVVLAISARRKKRQAVIKTRIG